MAKVSITEIIEGAQADASDANATLNSWESASVDIDAGNVRDEAIERRILAKEFQVFGDTNETDSFNGAYNLVTAGTVAFAELATPIHIGGFNPQAGDEIIVRASCGFDMPRTSRGASDDFLSIAIGSKLGSGGAVSAIQSTRREYQYDASSTIGLRGSYQIAHRYQGGVASDVWFTFMAGITSSGAPTIDLYNLYITAVLLRA